MSNYESTQWGMTGDVPLPGDFDGDGKADHAVFRPSTNYCFILRSSDGGVTARQFGIAVEQPFVSDLNADGRSEIGYTRTIDGQLYWQADFGNDTWARSGSDSRAT